MKRVLRWLAYLFIGFVLVVAILFLFRNQILTKITENSLSTALGRRVEIETFKLGSSRPLVEIHGMRIFNNAEFGGGEFIDINEFTLEYDKEALSDDRLHLKLLKLDIREINIVRDESGNSNIKEFASKLDFKDIRGFKLDRIETFVLSLDKVRFSNIDNPSDGYVVSAGIDNLTVHNGDSIESLTAVLLNKLLLEKLLFR
ncbi:MAG: AsmA family protein [Verrucomicrobia bacterium]|nr:AsmA family protein [Verrucomicrobiota bacterium]MCF7707770.1 AsmA family protein [Verrucomicrobiota bacterium]